MPNPPDTLILEAVDVRDGAHWYWRLKDAKERFLIDHEVALDDADWRYAAFRNLYGYLKYHTSPDQRRRDEERLLHELGAWIGQQVLGPIADKLGECAKRAPLTVRVVIPKEPEAASTLFYLPLELGHANGKPLALQDVSLVFERADTRTDTSLPVGERLRMLAVFSLPTGANALNLRQERHRLKHLIRSIATNKGLAIDLRVLQYGVTREALQDILEEGEGWDVLHFSGHGLATQLILEKIDGRIDPVTSEELLELLRPARGRLKWVTLSACQSAAVAVKDTLRRLGLEEPMRQERFGESAETSDEAESGPSLPALAQMLMDELDCAVLAMRYPVEDAFAIELGKQLYQGVFEKGQSLTRALQIALSHTLKEIDCSPLSATTPTLFGRTAAALQLRVPKKSKSSFPVASTGLVAAGFLPEPPLFVGRVRVLAQASQALAPQSDFNGVLFYGMAGAGKTACALELAYHYEKLERFQGFVWYQAPEQGKDIDRELLNFARAMEKLPYFKMVHVVDRAEELNAFLLKLTQTLDQESFLIVLDNLESLLRSTGEWRDESWGRLITALLTHRGESRVILTSRIRPALKLPAPARLLELPIHALNLDEAALLTRQLPNLKALLRGDTSQRQLVLRTLEVVQGHPELIKLAEGQAVDAKALERHLERATEEWAAGGARLEAFFQEGESKLEEGDFLRALSDWTAAVAGTLSPAARELFLFLCCLEEADRQSGIVKIAWPNLWKRLERAGEAPTLGAALDELAAVGLVAVDEVVDAEGEAHQVYGIHPGVAEAGCKLVREAVQAAVDTELAAFWRAVFNQGLKQEVQGGGSWVVLAGQRAASYLLRRACWAEASALLEQVLLRDTSPAKVAGLLPLLRQLAQVTAGTEEALAHAGVLARALRYAGRVAEAEAKLRELIEQTAGQGAYRWASGLTSEIIDLLRASGRAAEALEMVERKQDYTRRAGLGPWSQLSDEAQRLHLLAHLGRCEEVLEAVAGFRGRLKALPETGDQKEAVRPYNVREVILDAGRRAAHDLERWEEALALNAEVVASKQARGAPPLELARTRFNDHLSLLRLKRYAEARDLLDNCRTAFAAGNVEDLGAVFGALADLEDKLGHQVQAIAFVKAALRYSYLADNPEGCASNHFNLANCLRRADGPAEAALAQRLAGMVMWFQIGSGKFHNFFHVLTNHLAAFTDTPPPLPPDFATLCEIVEHVEGVRFRELFERLPTDRAANGDEALQEVLKLAAQAMQTNDTQPPPKEEPSS